MEEKKQAEEGAAAGSGSGSFGGAATSFGGDGLGAKLAAWPSHHGQRRPPIFISTVFVFRDEAAADTTKAAVAKTKDTSSPGSGGAFPQSLGGFSLLATRGRPGVVELHMFAFLGVADLVSFRVLGHGGWALVASPVAAKVLMQRAEGLAAGDSELVRQVLSGYMYSANGADQGGLMEAAALAEGQSMVEVAKTDSAMALAVLRCMPRVVLALHLVDRLGLGASEYAPAYWAERGWEGVTVDGNGEVVKLKLANRGANGDLNKVQWPAALQNLDVQQCYGIKGDLSKVQWPATLQSLDLKGCKKVEGDLSKVQWPEALAKLRLGDTKVAGDLSKVQWPASLQKLDLSYCGQITDLSKVQEWPAALQSLDLQYCNRITGDLSKVQWPAALQNLNLEQRQNLNLQECNGIEGDLSKVQWPAALQTLSLESCYSIEGDLSKVQWPAALQNLNLMGCEKVQAVKWPEALQTLSLSLTNVSGDISAAKWPEGLEKLSLGSTKVS
eukprot:g5558.t1